MFKKFFPVILFLLGLVLESSASAKTLVITDSHGEGAFGEALADQLEKKGEEVSFYAVGGSSPVEWNRGLPQIWGYWEYHSGKPAIRSTKPITPRLSDLLKTVVPQTLLIELGTNLIWRPITEQDREELRALLQTVQESGVKCYWVGPPDLRPKPIDREKREYEIREILETMVPGNGCDLIKSWEFTQYPATGGDGIHYDVVTGIGPELSRNWARQVAQQIP